MKPFDKKEKSDCSASDDSPPQRPKRNTCQKSAGVTNGLLWREETDLKKALYASLQENKRRNWEEEGGEENPDEEEQSLPAEGVIENGVEESPKKAKVHAQRKFAQGSTPSSPVLTPQKIPSVNNSTTQLLPYKRPKTEDFLTFLCLRGTSILPPSLDFLNSCSKSDTSSDCRSLSPELQDFKETSSKHSDAREKNNQKLEGGENGLPRKIGACRASSKRYPEGPPIKRLNFANSKFNKALPSKKRKLQDENDDPSRVKSNVNSKGKSTCLKALKEKYKKQRLAADKKKLLPAKSSNNSTASKKITVAQKSETNAKLSTVASKSVPSKKQIKVSPAIAQKPKLSKVEKKLAVEKRKSLRSADVRPRRLAALRKKTPWLRRAKLVPPIVDVESDSSEPEIIHTTPVKKVPVAPSTQKKLSKLNHVSDRLRSKHVTSKTKDRLTSRQILLQKHMQNHMKTKKSILHTKNIRSRQIIKRTAKQAILKKVKKNIVIKTMSLRKDLQNKRVTRSAKHQIEEMLWSNPEKRSRVQNQKQAVPSKSEKKKPSNEANGAVSKKPKSAVAVKSKEQVKVPKITKESLKRKSHSTSYNEKAAKPSAAPKVSESTANPSKISRRSLSRDDKPAPSSTTKSHSVTSNSSKTSSHPSTSLNVTKTSNQPSTSLNITKTSSHHLASLNLAKSGNSHLGSSATTKTVSHSSGSSSTAKAVSSSSGSSHTAKAGIHQSGSSSVTKTVSTPSSSLSAPKTISHHSKQSIENTEIISESKINKPSIQGDFKRESKIASNIVQEQSKTVAESSPKSSSLVSKASNLVSKASKVADEGNKSNSSIVNNELNKIDAKVSLEKEPFVKLDINNKDNNFWNMANSNIFGSDKNVQNNLNSLEPEKSSNKDISNLIALNVNCEEVYTQNSDPCCSGISHVKEKNVSKMKDSKTDVKEVNVNKVKDSKTDIKEVNVNKVKDSKSDIKVVNISKVKDSKSDAKEVNVKQDIKIHKKSHDKKSVKKNTNKEDKVPKCNTDKDKSMKKSDKGEIKSPKKHTLKERRSSKETDSNDVKKRKEISKNKAENGLNTCDPKNISLKLSNEKKNSKEKFISDSHEKKNNNKEKNVSDSHENKHSDKPHKKDNFGEKSPTIKTNKQSNDENKSLIIKDAGNSEDKNSSDDVFKVKNSDSIALPMDVDRKVENDIHLPSCSKDYSRNVLNSNSSGTTSRETDDDSDYDLTLDQFIKLNALKTAEKSGSSPVKSELNSSIKTAVVENKDSKLIKKECDKEGQKHKKDGESSKHKKDKDGSKSKGHDKDQRTPKKEDRASKKDSEKSLAKLLKKEKEKLKSNKREEKSKHKKDSSSKSSKKDGEKDISKLVKKDCEDSSIFSNLGESSLEHSENKKEKVKKEFKLSRSSSCDETKSPKKKKKHNEFKDIEKIKNLISKSSILSEFSGFKEFKRRSSSDKSELKKSKKRKKLALLKEKKLSKKLSSKLLRKYSKKKGLKSKKNKLKKKELKERKIADLENKILKSKKQKHKTKSDHHSRDDKAKNIEVSVSATAGKSVEISSATGTAQFFAKVAESQCISFTNTTSEVISSNPSICSNTVSTVTSSVPTYIIESVPEVIPPIDSISNQISQPIAAPAEQYVFGSADELQSIVTSDFTGVFDETFTTGAILLATRDTISQVPLHFIQDISVPKTMADAATNTGEDDIEESLDATPEVLKNDEMSVGTQTITPSGSPSPTVEIQPLILPENKEPVAESSTKTAVPPKETINPVPSVSLVKTPDEALPAVVTPTKPATSNVSSSAGTPSPKTKRRSSFHKKSKTHSILLPKGQPFPVDSAKMVAAPVFYPTIEEFRDPLEYIYKIQGEAAQFGICKIVPPSSFKPECKVNDDMRFTAHNQYVHKMLHRWGPNVKHTACIKKHLKSQKMKLEQAPLIGGIELDISRFYHTVQQYGGLQQVIEKKKWQRVADTLRVPKTAQDRVTKLYDAYCKYLVSYDTLPMEEKEKLEKDVIADHEKRVKLRSSPKPLEKEEEELDDEENTECVSKGRSMSLSNFFRIARNTMNMWFKNAPSPDEVEHEYWKVVTESQHHVVVHAGNIDSSVYQSGFPCNRNSPFAKHPWNLKILTNNSSSILRCMGPVSGITIPTLHVGMLFTTGCWYRDPHSLPWIEYLHTGASKIWYSIPAKGCEKFRESMKKIMPEYCTNNPIWLPSDTAMVPPELLVKHGASLSRTIQNSGQFVVIFPESFTSTICCGYCVSESVYFAPASWLDSAVKAFQDIQSSCEPPAFSLERLLFSIANDPKTHPETLQKILPLIQNIRAREMQLRSQLSEAGLKQCERLPLLDTKDKKKKSRMEDECEQECEVCRAHCYVSMVVYSQEDTIYCLPHALEHIPRKNLKLCKLMFTYDEKELKELETKIVELISTHLAKLSAKKKSPKKKLTPAPEK